MKFKVTMKDPDGVYNSILEAVDGPDGASKEWSDGALEDYLRQWFEYGEYLTVEIDTDTNEIKVLEVR